MPEWTCPICVAAFESCRDLALHDAANHTPPTVEPPKPPVTPPLSEPDFTTLRSTVDAYLTELREKGYADEDFDTYISEAAIEAFYGKGIWSEVNALMK